jgi:hypothetical protein
MKMKNIYKVLLLLIMVGSMACKKARALSPTRRLTRQRTPTYRPTLKMVLPLPITVLRPYLTCMHRAKYRYQLPATLMIGVPPP